MFIYRAVKEPEQESEPEFVTIATNVCYKPDVSRAIIDCRDREIKELRKQLEYAKRCTTVDVVGELIPQYTGLPDVATFDSLLSICTGVGINYWEGWEPKSIAKREQLLLVLMKLRMNLSHDDLGFRFSISPTSVSNLVITWVLVLEAVLESIMKDIPSLVKNQKSMPGCFSDYRNTRIILDCTEIKVDVPANLDEQNQTWSSYKHANTFKALVGVAPNGTVTFAGELYGGCASDKAITAHSNVLKEMKSGETVMVDKGFKIQDLTPKGVGINIPPFLVNPQFTAEECVETRFVP